ncbi:MAG: polysaccharide biosynthesis tyrosine autokinase, partial [Prevotella sp.]
MEESKIAENVSANPQTNADEQKGFLDFGTIYATAVLNWKWFVLSLIICLGAAAIYLRYTTPIYEASAKLLIKDNDGRTGNRNNMMNSATLGVISNSTGIDNEMEILTSHSLAIQAVRDLKLYTNYFSIGKVKDIILYHNQPISVDIDAAHLEKLNAPVDLMIEREGNTYRVTGQYYIPHNDGSSSGPYALDKTFTKFPATINTRAGILYFTTNGMNPMAEGQQMRVNIQSPKYAAYKYVGNLSVGQTGKGTTIALLILKDEVPQRAVDFLRQLAFCYNRQANEDKNEIAVRTEEFINGRLEKINAELGNTEGQLENYKKSNRMVELKMNATQALTNADTYSQKLTEANTQIALLNEMRAYMTRSGNKYQPLPLNIGLTDQATNTLIKDYNEVAQKRNLLLQSASEKSPSVIPLTTQLDQLQNAIKRALNQAMRSSQITRNSVAAQAGKYQGQVDRSPVQERMLNQIGRQQEVKSGLYLMLLQKREENSISLAATADKGKLIDDPAPGGKISPKDTYVLLIGLLIGLALPAIILLVIQLFRYKIEGHEDVARLTRLPILADVAVASEVAKDKADIVIHENQNNMMEEIFRSMRTNLLFMMKEGQKVIMCTSTNSGEGKTFNAGNLAMSFALLGKKVLLIGLDIRKPRLGQLFELNDTAHGITNLLIKESPTEEQIKQQILPSGINDNLDIMTAGPIPPNPAELVARPSLDIIMKQLREMYDYIIIDTAPVGLVTDTLAIGRVSDATVYVCRADYTPKESFELINGLAMEQKLPNISIVINGIDMSKKKHSYYYGYGRYGRYGRYG